GKELERKELSTLNSQLSTLNFVPGVYVLRLIDGDSIRTQKMIVE
ncbi:MAG: T9SS type A sorting domain-containing protein, partial [Bacteroidales bacterium]|nr:T9SS type A sorting domain-containing protein [Bacteroidales bacterium]